MQQKLLMNYINKEKIIEVLLQRHYIRFAYLFGSQVKGQTRLGSDLDIAIYFKNEPDITAIGALVLELEAAANCEVDLVSLNDLYKKNPKLAYSIIDEGILLLCLDEALLAQYKKMSFLSYLDFKPIIDLFTRKLYERVSNNMFAVEPRSTLPAKRENK
jgi:predicted nucleotidyltransferase